MPLKNRDAAGYVVWRAFQLRGRPIHVEDSDRIIDEMLSVLPAAARKLFDRAWRAAAAAEQAAAAK